MNKKIQKLIALLAVVVVVCGAVPAFADSVDEIIHKAQGGNAQAQAQLGYMYCLLGANNKNNLQEEWYQEAVKWYLKSAEQGFSPAQEALGDMYSDGLGVRQDYSEAVKWYRKAAENKNTPPYRVSEVKDKLQIAQIYLDDANEYPSQSQTQRVAYDVPNLLDFDSGVLRFVQKGVDDDIHRYYNYRCNRGYDGGIAERFVNTITSAYPFVVIKHYSNESKYGNLEIWALQYTGNKHVRTYRRTFGKDKTVYQCHITISKRTNHRNSFVSFTVGVSNELSYGGDTSSSGGAYAHSNATSSGSSSSTSFGSSGQPTVRRERCTRCSGNGTIRCDRCDNGYIYLKKVDPPSFTGVRPSSSIESQLCYKCHGSGKMKCNFCDGNGYVDRYY